MANLRSYAFLLLLGHAANEAVNLGHLDPAAPNRNPNERRAPTWFDAQLGSIPIRASMNHWHFDEVRFAVAAWPTPDVDEWLQATNEKGLAADVTVHGWLERRNGRLRLSCPLDPLVFMRRHRRSELLALPIPNDAADPLRLHPRYLTFAAAA